MFLHEFTEPQRQAFLTLAARLSSADGSPSDAELALIIQMREEMDLPPSWRPSWENTDVLLNWFVTPRDRAIAILELLRLARSDQKITERELTFIREVARTFELSKERVRRLASWLARHEALLQDGDRLLGS
ncbi:MAG: TerB family tellurite resistance protein [Myxococcota bacterium]